MNGEVRRRGGRVFGIYQEEDNGRIIGFCLKPAENPEKQNKINSNSYLDTVSKSLENIEDVSETFS